MKRINNHWWQLFLAMTLVFLAGCTTTEETAVPATDDHDQEHEAEADMLTLPELTAVPLDGAPLKVVATTSIIGDVVAQVGGEVIDLTTLMGPGQDPHSFEPSARELTAVADADVIFVNGWGLEETLVTDLAEIAADVPLVPISANIEPLAFGETDYEEESDDHAHGSADPHVWFSVANVQQWVENVQTVFSELDPTNIATYESNAAAYLTALADLDTYANTQLAQIPTEKRFLVTNHDSFGYFAEAYDFTVLGTVIPGRSTLAEPSASDLTALVATMAEHNLCTLFTEATVSDSLAKTAAGELTNCDEVQVLPLYTGAIGPSSSGADSFVGMFRANVDAIVEGLNG